MAKRAISITLDADHVTWLKGQAGASGETVSALVDGIVAAARGAGAVGAPRSVVGTIDLDPADPLLEHADAYVRTVFERSIRRPPVVRETAPAYGVPRKRRRPHRGA